jgi:hypothetical protein
MTAPAGGSGDGRLTREKLGALLGKVGAQAGVDVRDAQLVKFTNNAVFRLPRAPVVVRIAGSQTMRHRVPKVLQVARWLESEGVPAVRLVHDIEQPLEIEGQLVTLWRRVEEVPGSRATGCELGAILRRVHTLPEPSFGLPPWKPFDEIRERLAEAEGIDGEDLEFLLARCDDIEAALAELEYVLEPGPIHGDAFPGNLIVSPAGIVCCDFDSTSTGPREWDLIPVAVGKLRFDYPGQTYAELTAAYRFDVMAWSGFPVLRQVRELKLVTSVVPILRSNPSILPQWRHRLDSFKRGDPDVKWTTYGQ